MALVDEAIMKIRDLIRSGQLAPGSRLPAEAQLAAELGMSRNSMREAVKVLEASKVLDVRRGDGTYVTSLSPDLLLGGLAFAVDLLDERYLLETVEVRRMLEPAATAAAASRVRPEQLAFLRTLLEYMQASVSVAETMIQYDMEFHRAVVSAAGNETLSAMLESLSSATVRARIWRGMIEADAARRTMTEHQAIYDALATGDQAVAHAAALVHVNTSERWLRYLTSGDPRPAAGAGQETAS